MLVGSGKEVILNIGLTEFLIQTGEVVVVAAEQEKGKTYFSKEGVSNSLKNQATFNQSFTNIIKANYQIQYIIMKTTRINLIVFALLAIIFLSSCHDDVFGVRGEGPVVTQTRTISDFNQIDLKVSGEVFITQGSIQEVRIEAQRNILDILETDVRNSKLEIYFGRHWARRHKEIKVYITVPEITGLKVSGSGKITGQSDFETSYLNADIPGSGSIDFSVANTETIDADISGSGNIHLYGDCKSLKMVISGSGRLRAFELTTENADIKISGSGNSDVFVEKHLKASVSGSGKIQYKGNPTTDVKVSGSGKVTHVD